MTIEQKARQIESIMGGDDARQAALEKLPLKEILELRHHYGVLARRRMRKVATLAAKNRGFK